jgi:hypothetical protein
MNNLENFLNNFSINSRHHKKLIDFIYPELNKIEKANILNLVLVKKQCLQNYLLNIQKIINVIFFLLIMLIIQ